MRTLTLLPLLSLLAASSVSAESRVAFETHGFDILVLEPEAPASAPSTPLLMSLPPKDGFAPNVNVTIQPFPDTMDAYIALSRKQYETMGLTLIREIKTEKGEWFSEYTGAFQNKPLHWYSRAVQKNGKIYLITATAPEPEWEALSAKLRAVVNSFRLTR